MESAVVDHYDTHKPVPRGASSIADLRVLNNFVKTRLIARVARQRQCVLDLCAGKGGDLGKWARHEISRIVLLDASEQSLTEATARHIRTWQQRCALSTIQVDAFSPECGKQLRRHGLVYDVASCQFALHYAFQTRERAQQAFDNVAAVLKVGARFIVSVPSATRILAGHATGYARIVFAPGTTGAEPFGGRYTFYLPDAVAGVDEFLVHRPSLLAVAEHAGFAAVEETSFADLFAVERRTRDGAALYTEMMRGLGEPSTAALETMALYDAYTFVKKGR